MAKGSRDTHEDADTVIAVSSEEIIKARAAATGGLSLEDTSTVDIHPLIIEEGTELASDSGFVRRPKGLGGIDLERRVNEDTETVSLVAELPPDIEETTGETEEISIEPIDVSAAAAAVAADGKEETDPTLKPSAEVKRKKEDVETDPTLKPPAAAKPAAAARPAAPPRPPRPVKSVPPADFDDETKTRQREALREPQETKDLSTDPIPIDKAKMLAPPNRDQTMPIPITGDIGGALETVPLNANMVQQVLQQVDARAAARAAGQPVPAFNLQPAPPATDPQAALRATAPSQQRVPASPPMPMAPPRRVGVEVAIAVFAFLVVAVPALYYMWIHFQE